MHRAAVTHYEILHVSRRARPEGVRRAYRRLAQRYHPDKLGGHADAERVMAALNEAYAVLSDPERRASYDRAIGASRPRAGGFGAARDARWPWYLLFSTIAFSALAVGISVYISYVPGAALFTGASR
jgi:curved DNA-binding protein CbpA